jgi:hypothetical protein
MILWCFGLYLAVFFSPGDLFYSLVTIKPVYVPICVLKEIYRAKKIFAGLAEGAQGQDSSPTNVTKDNTKTCTSHMHNLHNPIKILPTLYKREVGSFGEILQPMW